MSKKRFPLQCLGIASISLCVSVTAISPLRAEETLVKVAPLRQSDPATRTGKERLSGKASDDQRVNDCKVPEDQRGAGARPADCSTIAGSTLKAPPQPSE